MVVRIEASNISVVEGSISFRSSLDLSNNVINMLEKDLKELGRVTIEPGEDRSTSEVEYKMIAVMNRWDLDNKISMLSKTLCNYGIENVELLTIDEFLEYDNIINAFSTSVKRWKDGNLILDKKALFSTNEDDYKFLTGEELCKNSKIQEGVLKPEWIKIYDKFWNHWAEV